MKNENEFSITTETKLGFDEVIELATKLLQERGFGILTEIDVKATLKKKLDIDYKPYRILGACNPTYAHGALNLEPYIGVLMPCTVVVWDNGDHRLVTAMDPRAVFTIVDNPEVHQVAKEVYQKLYEVIKSIEEAG